MVDTTAQIHNIGVNTEISDGNLFIYLSYYTKLPSSHIAIATVVAVQYNWGQGEFLNTTQVCNAIVGQWILFTGLHLLSVHSKSTGGQLTTPTPSNTMQYTVPPPEGDVTATNITGTQ